MTIVLVDSKFHKFTNNRIAVCPAICNAIKVIINLFRLIATTDNID